MKYRTYILYCLIGAVLWVFGIAMLGFLFGNVPIVKENFEKVVLGIILVSVLPIFYGIIRAKLNKRKA
jgi:membrane-associated protein